MTLRVPALSAVARAMHLALDTRDTAAAVQVCARRRPDINVANVDVLAHRRTRALQVPDKRVVFFARGALEVLDRDIFNRQIRRKLVAQRDVLLPIALRDFDRVVDI
jgi:hypothetical protein